MILYHGTNLASAKDIYSEGINVFTGSKSVDFGPGFYTTDSFDRAIRWANRKARLRSDVPEIVSIEFNEQEADSCIERFEDDIRWGRFIINNRNGLRYIDRIKYKEHNLTGRYHITCGRIADVDVTTIADILLSSGEMLNSLDGILNKDYPLQYAFHTDYSLGFIRKVSYRAL